MSNTYTIEIKHQGETYTIQAPEDKTILQAAADAGLELPTSCGAGVCTTCAAQIVKNSEGLKGTVNQDDCAGLSPNLQAEGYVLLCVAYPRSDISLETEKEDTVYSRQFQQM